MKDDLKIIRKKQFTLITSFYLLYIVEIKNIISRKMYFSNLQNKNVNYKSRKSKWQTKR